MWRPASPVRPYAPLAVSAAGGHRTTAISSHVTAIRRAALGCALPSLVVASSGAQAPAFAAAPVASVSLRHRQQVSEGRYKRTTTYEIYPERAQYQKDGDSLAASVGSPPDGRGGPT